MAAIAGLFVWLAFVNIWIFVFVVGVVISIFLHEFGHYITARWTGMKVTQFFLFFGPRLWSFRRGETEYGVRALPLGAFVRIIGMNRMDEVEPEDEARTYRQQSFPKRLLVISAGSIMHMIIAIVLLFGVYATVGEITSQDEPRVIVGAADVELPAAQAGIRADDEIVPSVVSGSRRPSSSVKRCGPSIPVTSSTSSCCAAVPNRPSPSASAPTPTVPEDDPLFGTALLGVSTFSPAQYEDHGSAARR